MPSDQDFPENLEEEGGATKPVGTRLGLPHLSWVTPQAGLSDGFNEA